MKTKHKSAAIITINNPGRMTTKGRRQIVEWMRRQAAHLAKHGKEYTEGRFTARFIYVPKLTSS